MMQLEAMKSGGKFGQDKFDHFHEKAKKIENDALMKEQLLKIQKGGGGIPEANEVDDMLIDAIRAKLTLLDEI